MKVKLVTRPDEHIVITLRKMTQTQLQIEYDYFQGKKIAEKLLEKGYINSSEYDRIMDENLRVFPTILGPIL